MEAAAGHLDPFLHGDQAEVAVADQGGGGLGLEADAVVADAEVHPVAGSGQLDPEAAGAGVAGHVQEGLLGDPVDDGLELTVEAAGQVDPDRAGHAGAAGERADMVAQGRLQSDLVQGRGAQRGHQLP